MGTTFFSILKKTSIFAMLSRTLLFIALAIAVVYARSIETENSEPEMRDLISWNRYVNNIHYKKKAQPSGVPSPMEQIIAHFMRIETDPAVKAKISCVLDKVQGGSMTYADANASC